jgi:hypothetical protein
MIRELTKQEKREAGFRTFFDIGKKMFKAGKFAFARSFFEKAFGVDANSSDALYQAGLCAS